MPLNHRRSSALLLPSAWFCAAYLSVVASGCGDVSIASPSESLLEADGKPSADGADGLVDLADGATGDVLLAGDTGADVTGSDSSVDAGTSDTPLGDGAAVDTDTAAADTTSDATAVDGQPDATSGDAVSPDTAPPDTAVLDADKADGTGLDAADPDAATPDTTPDTTPDATIEDGGDAGCWGKPGCGCKTAVDCDDNNACTGPETCIANICAASKPVDCDDGDPCTDHTCAKATGCTTTKKPAGATCDDGDVCTLATVCTAGKCTGKPKICDDDNLCTADGCDPKKGCVASPTGEGAACADDMVCKNGVCTEVGCLTGPYKGSATIAKVGKATWSSFAKAHKALQKCGIDGVLAVSVAAGTYIEPGFRLGGYKGKDGKITSQTVTFAAANTSGGYAKVLLQGTTGASTGAGIIVVDKAAANLTIEGFELAGDVAANKIPGQRAGPVVVEAATGPGAHAGIVLRGLFIHDFKATAWAQSGYVGGIWSESDAGGDITIDRCRIDGLQPPSAHAVQGGIVQYKGAVTLRVTRSRFAGIAAMDIIQIEQSPAITLLVANNELVVQGTGALDFSGVSKGNAYVFFNSMLALNTAWAIRQPTNGGVVVQLTNNILASVFSSPPTMVIGKTVTAAHNALYKTKPGYNSNTDIEVDPQFKDTLAPGYDLHIGASSPVKGLAGALAKIPLTAPDLDTDIDGDKRESPADIGMDEVPGGVPLKPCTNGKIAPMTGVYRIGPNADFATFSASFAALIKCGVTGPTTFLVAPGTYSEPGFHFPAAKGVSAAAPLKYKADVTSGAPTKAKVWLVGVTTSGARRGVIRLADNLQYVTLDGFSIDGAASANKLPGSRSGAIVTDENGGQQHIALRNLSIAGYTPSTWPSTFSGMLYVESSASLSDFAIEGCDFSDNQASAAGHSTVGVITFFKGNHTDVRIERNRLVGNNTDVVVSRGVAWTDLRIVNNMVQIENNRALLSFPSLANAKTPIVIVHNSLLLANGGAAVTGSLYGKGVDFRNNAAQGVGGVPKLLHTGAVAASGYNCLASAVGGYNKTLGDKIMANVGFTTITKPVDLHLLATSACQKSALAMKSVTDDFDSQPRGAAPDIGADEIN